MATVADYNASATIKVLPPINIISVTDAFSTAAFMAVFTSG